jgi:2-keto-4-pentenoate hydratase/2-oxohepta-3-ene-1,7-dioic acid hydratase in catechol pathway
MRWTTYVSRRDGLEHIGIVVNGRIHGLAGHGRLLDLLGDDGTMLAETGARALSHPWETIALAGAPLRAPIPVPPSIRDFMAFEEHVVTSARALDHDVDPVWYEMPVFYFTNPAAVYGPNDDIPVAPGSQAWDYELEIAAVIGRGGRDLDPATAEEHIAGYLIFCDWSARDLQGSEMRAHLGPAKGKDTATTLGPWLVTPDELAPRRAGNAYDLEMTASVNGEVWSRGNMSTIYWSIGQLLAYASRGTVLRPGDIIGSGTVGTGCILELSRVHGSERYPWLTPGDVVTLEIAGLGAIESRIVAGAAVVPIERDAPPPPGVAG